MNRVKQALQSGDASVGMFVLEFFTDRMPAIMGTTGCEWAMYDMEHSSMGFETLRRMAACSAGPTAPLPFVRIPVTEYRYIAGALDAGVRGIMAPMVETADQARALVRAAKFPPQGRRGAGTDLYSAASIREATLERNDDTLLIAQVESPDGLANIDEIAAVEGIDVLMTGQVDFSVTSGIPGEFSNPIMGSYYQAVVDAARRHGKVAATAGVSDRDAAQLRLEQGFQMIGWSGDIGLLVEGLTRGVDIVRELAASKP